MLVYALALRVFLESGFLPSIKNQHFDHETVEVSNSLWIYTFQFRDFPFIIYLSLKATYTCSLVQGIDEELALAAEAFLEGDDGCVLNMPKREVKYSDVFCFRIINQTKT